MSRPLLSCPFCGSPAKLRTGRVSEDAESASVQCTGCFATTDDFEDAYAPIEQAVATWNQRSGKGPAPAVGDELVKAATGLANETDALRIAEMEIRQIIGNTNWMSLRYWVNEVRAALSSDPRP